MSNARQAEIEINLQRFPMDRAGAGEPAKASVVLKGKTRNEELKCAT
jgi:hypothetical protein